MTSVQSARGNKQRSATTLASSIAKLTPADLEKMPSNTLIKIIRCSQRVLRKSIKTAYDRKSHRHKPVTVTFGGPTKDSVVEDPVVHSQLQSARLLTAHQESIITRLREENKALWVKIGEMNKRAFASTKGPNPAYQPLFDSIKAFLASKPSLETKVFDFPAEQQTLTRQRIEQQVNREVRQVIRKQNSMAGVIRHRAAWDSKYARVIAQVRNIGKPRFEDGPTLIETPAVLNDIISRLKS